MLIYFVYRRQWGKFDTDLWRMEQWLVDAEAKLNKSKEENIPTSVDQIEDTIQNHKVKCQ